MRKEEPHAVCGSSFVSCLRGLFSVAEIPIFGAQTTPSHSIMEDTMKNPGLLMVAVLMLCTGSIVLSAQSERSNGATHLEAEFTLSVFNDCCDESVQLSGTAYYIQRKNGGHVNSRGATITGTGSSGRLYTGRYVGMRNTNTNDNGQFAQTQIQKMSFTSEDGCSFTLEIRIRTTTNAAGETVVETDVRKISCEDDAGLE